MLQFSCLNSYWVARRMEKNTYSKRFGFNGKKMSLHIWERTTCIFKCSNTHHQLKQQWRHTRTSLETDGTLHLPLFLWGEKKSTIFSKTKYNLGNIYENASPPHMDFQKIKLGWAFRPFLKRSIASHNFSSTGVSEMINEKTFWTSWDDGISQV